MKKQLLVIAAAAVLFIAGLALQQAGPVWLSPALCVLSYLTVGGEVLLRAARNICRGKVFDENFLMCVATIGAFGVQEYPEAAAVMLFYQVGELFQQYAVDKSRRSIAALMDIRPDSAWKLIDGQAEKVEPETVAVGDLIQVRPGEKVPLDGVVTEGDAMLNTAALTGESVPREARPGDDILSGSINLNGVITVRVTKVFSESTVSKILDLVENASARKAKSEQFISRFAAVYTPIVVIAAVLLAAVPVLLFHQPFTVWLTRALTFLVVSCPCALVISVPLSFFGGIGGAAKAGILVKGGNYLEALSHTEIAVFDKTGTLTRGVFAVQEVRPVGMTEQELLQLAAAAEQFSAHPIAQSLRDACPQAAALAVQEVRETSGHGVSAEVSGRPVCVGSERMLTDAGIACLPVEEPGTVVHVAVSGAYAGYIRIADTVKPDAAETIARLKAAHVRRTVMLTGDALSAGQAVGTALGMDAVYAELLPADKLDRLEQLLATLTPAGRLIFVGDGINDAPVLARADVGIAMGALGADAAIEAADVVIMTDEPSKVSAAIRIAQKTLRIVRQNIVFALGVKIVVLLLGAAGIVGMWAAVFADVGVSVLAILNALRMLRPNS